MSWPTLPSLLLIVLGLLMLSAGFEDIRRREIANWKNAAIALLAPLWWWSIGLDPWPAMAIQLGAAGIVFALFVGAFAIGWMGGGDVKMIGALALWLPLVPLLQMLSVMAIAGGIITVLMAVEHQLRRQADALEVPYGVAIACGGFVAIGEPLLNQFR